MVIAFRSASKTTYATGGTTTTINKPSSMVAGDLIILHTLLENGATSYTTTPSGFTQLIGLTRYAASGNGSQSYSAVYYKIATSSEPAQYIFTHTSSSIEATALAYSGVDNTNPFDVTSSVATGAGTTATATSITTTSPNTWRVFLGGMWSGWHETSTQSAGFTQRSWGTDYGLMAADSPFQAAGATGTASGTSSTNTGNGWSAFQLALRPAVQWLNHVTIALPRNGTNTHDASVGTVINGVTFAPTAGRLLVVAAAGAVTSTGTSGGAGSTAPSGWTNGASSVVNTGAYVWYKTATGSDTLTLNHNGSNYPVVVEYWEFPAGSTFVKGAGASVSSGSNGIGANAALTSIGTHTLLLALGSIANSAASSPTLTTTPTGTPTPILLTTAVANNTGTDGYGYSSAYLDDTATTSWTPTLTMANNEGPATKETVTWAINVGTSSPSGIPFKLGSSAITAMYLGSTQIKNVYLGSTKLY